MLSISLLYPQESFALISKQLGGEGFSMEELSIYSYLLLCQALSGNFQQWCGKICIFFLSLRFFNFIKSFCAHT